MPEIVVLSYIDRFGVKAVLGRDVLAYHEIRNMTLAENINHAYQSRKASDDWAKWAEVNPQNNRLLIAIEKELNAED